MKDIARKAGETPIAILSSPAEVGIFFQKSLPILDLGVSCRTDFGAPSLEGARAAFLSLERACDLTLRGEASALVTNPVSKAMLRRAGFRYRGQTEYLSARTKRRAVMMLAAPGLRVALVSTHLPLRDAPKYLTVARVSDTGETVAAALREDFGIAEPRLAVAALNPHAGEEGRLGREEIEIIAPAIENLRARGVKASGPHPADALFHKDMRRRYDAALCMYHDQALIPLKMLGREEGVNVSLGLPIVRTSPDHGTAFDIAGEGKADPSSLAAALKMAHRIAARRGEREGRGGRGARR